MLTDEQREKIAANRSRALEIQKERAKLNEFGDVEPIGTEKILSLDTSTDLYCEQVVGDSYCRKILSSTDLVLWNTFGEKCCFNCTQTTYPRFETISNAAIQEEYLLPTSTIAVMKYQEKVNPKNPGWKPMRLYLRKHAEEFSLKRWGSDEELRREIERRKVDKFEKELESTDSFFEKAVVSLVSTSTGDGSVNGLAQDLKVGIKRKGSKKWGKQSKKAHYEAVSAALFSL